MNTSISRKIIFCMLLCMTLLLSGCKQNPSEEKLYERLLSYFTQREFVCVVEAVPQEREVPIYRAEAWKKLLLNGEEVLVYFDESNRADYLCSGIDPQAFSFVGQFGLRFVLVYEGENAQVLDALRAMPKY